MTLKMNKRQHVIVKVDTIQYNKIKTFYLTPTSK